MQKEKEVLALLSRLDIDHVHFTESPPGMYCILVVFFPVLQTAVSFVCCFCVPPYGAFMSCKILWLIQCL